ncbi:hypothetical protein ACKVMT_06750 [Halobacteriales archaeon Cl-PHB]
MYEAACSQHNDFMVQSEDEREAAEMIKEHAREKHDMDLSDDDAHDMVEQTN